MATTTRSDLSIVKLWDSSNKSWREITCGKPKVERKQDINKRVACNSKKPYELNPGEVEYTLELPEVRIEHYGFFDWVMNRQESFAPLQISIAIFRYDKNGKTVRDHYLRGVTFESMSQEGNDAFDLKGSATQHEK